MTNLYEQLSEERKQGQLDGTVPEWMSTAGYQMFKQKYLYQAANPKEQFRRIARTAAKHAPKNVLAQDKVFPIFDQIFSLDNSYDKYAVLWEEKFFEILWNGWLACSTPVLANMGTNRGCTVSCAGSVVEDSVLGFYDAYREIAILTKEGFGTAADLSAIRPRGSPISVGGTASGVLPVIKHFVQDMRDVAQGTARRGAFATYLDIEHGDFWEVVQYLEEFPDDCNIGWIIHDKFIKKLQNGNKEATKRYHRAMKVKMITGRGYFFFIDKVNRNRPQMYKDLKLDVKAAQLCCEIHLHSSKDLTYTCVLSWMNASKYREWKDTDAVFVATVFLDCVVSEFLEQAKDIVGMEKALASTKKGRAIGLGCGGLHTLYQQEFLPFDSIDAHLLNKELFATIKEKSEEASRWLAVELGEPEWCKGYGVRNTHLQAVAPTKSTALIYGGISEGVNPDTAFSFTQSTSAGEVARVNPTLLKLIKGKGLDVEACIKDVDSAKGSVQRVTWLTDTEKAVFKTAFEISQEAILRQAAARQKYLSQGQSLNLFFRGSSSEEEISRIHQLAFENEDILGLYYIYSLRETENQEAPVILECESCQ